VDGECRKTDDGAGYVGGEVWNVVMRQPQPVSPQNTKGEEDHGRETNLLST